MLPHPADQSLGSLFPSHPRGAGLMAPLPRPVLARGTPPRPDLTRSPPSLRPSLSRPQAPAILGPGSLHSGALSHRSRVTPCLCPSGPTGTRALPGRPPTLALPPQVFRLTVHVVVRTLRPRGDQSQSFWDREATRGNPDLSSPTACVPRGQETVPQEDTQQLLPSLTSCFPKAPSTAQGPPVPESRGGSQAQVPGCRVRPGCGTRASAPLSPEKVLLGPYGGLVLHWETTTPMGCRPGPSPQEATPILVESRAALQAKPSLERGPMKLQRRASGTTASALPTVGPSPVPATSPKGACRRDQLSPQTEWNPAPAACGSPRLDERRAYSTSTCGHKHTPDLEEPICYSWPPPSGPGPSLDPSLLGVGVTSGQPAKGLRVLTSGGPAEAPGHGAGAPQHLEGSRQQASLHGPDLGPPSPRSPRRSRTEEPAQPRTFRLTEGIGYASTVT
ncbi:synapsin-1-like [Mustela lutreola]|uniref:synapsin-1-like n=1 Tax=Mustela lutreola TaxID=9666 RepID=UPI0027971FF2|nr:synapsin-1-like [Mustela lutreola]